MASFRQTNSWHWLWFSLALSILIGGVLFNTMRKAAFSKDTPEMQEIDAMQAHSSELVLLQPEDVMILEKQASDLQKRLTAYEAAVREQSGQEIPEGEKSVLLLGNDINRALYQHKLRVIEQEQMEFQERTAPVVSSASGRVPSEAAQVEARLAAEIEAKTATSLPFETREIRYVVVGEYRHMFMFLVRQSHLKPPYHFKDIKISPTDDNAAMRMVFTVEVHFI